MGEMHLPTSRVALVDKTVRSFVDGFLKPIDQSGPSTEGNHAILKTEFLKPYHPDIHWYDHAFLICRVGHEAVIGLQTAFRHCNDPFDCEIKVGTGCNLDRILLRFQSGEVESLVALMCGVGHHTNVLWCNSRASVDWEVQ
jgi:hypothetical protein